MTSPEKKPVLGGWPPEMYEPGRYLSSKICRVCGVEVADVFRERHAAFHKSLVTLWKDTNDH